MNQILSKQEEKGSSCSYFYIFIKCILSLFIWVIFIVFILLNEDKNSDLLIPILGMILSYILYFIFEICSPTLSLLCSKPNKDYDDIISDFRQAAPEINFTCFDEIYNGHKIASHKFHYKFCMDNSEIPFLNPEEENTKRKCFIKLKINKVIISNDQETYDKFSQKKQEYSNEMETGKKWVDISFSGLKKTYLISNGNNGNKNLLSLLLSIYIISIFLTLGVVYELILKCIILEKTITIKKIITIKDEFKIPVHSASNNESHNNISENGIIICKSGNNLSFKNNTENKYIFKNDTLKNSQNENESNRQLENDNIINSIITGET